MRHEFTVDRSVLKSLITAQSGTVHKALAELIHNAIDAKASRCDVTLTLRGFEVRDDGEGFSVESFREHFGKFGFPHEEHVRQIGRFGIGRGQVLALASTLWRTRTIEAKVDIEQEGYTYDLAEGLDDAPGVRVTGTFYKKLNGAEHFEALNELRNMCRYVQMHVTLNGEDISKHPASERWDAEDEHAWYRFSEGTRLSIYSQGIFVEDKWSGPFGTGGIVVTKVGHALLQNMSRSDLLTAKCPVWAAVEQRVRAAGRAAAGKQRQQNRLTDEARTAEVQALLTGESRDDLGLLYRGRHMTTVLGTHVSLEALAAFPVWTVCDERSLAAERLHKSGAVAVLSRRTLDRFSALTVADLLRKVRERMHRGPRSWYASRFDGITTQESMEDCPAYQQTDHEILSPKDLSEPQRLALSIARSINEKLATLLGKKPRQLVAGCSNHAEGWTDGKSFIAIESKLLKQAISQGLAGWSKLVFVLVHEYAHDAASNMAHGHTAEFYAEVHDALIDLPIVNIVAAAFSAACTRGKVSRPLASKLATLVDIDVELGRSDIVDLCVPSTPDSDESGDSVQRAA